jgi:hypothetical protein
MLAAMLRILPAAALILALVTSPLVAAPVTSVATATAVPDAALRADLHCAAAFAIAASEQARGAAQRWRCRPWPCGASASSPMSARVPEQGGMTQAAVRDLLVAEVTEMQRRGAADPDRELAAEVKPCLARLDAAVPPLQTPTLPSAPRS